MLCQCHQERLASHDEYAAVRRPVPAIDPVTRATPQCPYGQIQSKREPRVQPEPDMSMTSRFELLRTLLWSSGGGPYRSMLGGISRLVCLHMDRHNSVHRLPMPYRPCPCPSQDARRPGVPMTIHFGLTEPGQTHHALLNDKKIIHHWSGSRLSADFFSCLRREPIVGPGAYHRLW